MARKDTISLNGIEYFVRGPVISQPVSDFAANIRIGEPSYETRQGAGYAVMDDFSGGPGIRIGLVREDLSRWSYNEGVDTRWPRQMTAPLLLEQAAQNPAACDNVQTLDLLLHLRRTNRNAFHFAALPLSGVSSIYDVFPYGNNLNYQKPTDISLTWSQFDIGLDCILDAATYTPVTGALKGVEQIFCVGKTGWRRSGLSSASSNATFSEAAEADGGTLTKVSSVSYVACRAAASTPATVGWGGSVGQAWGTPTDYGIYRYYSRFATGDTIPDAATVTGATLRIYLTTDSSTQDFTIQVRKFTWSGGGLTDADWRGGGTPPSGDVLLGTYNTVNLPAVNNYFEIALTPSQVPKLAGQYLEIYLLSNRDDDDPGTAPTTLEAITFGHISYKTQLYVTWTTDPATPTELGANEMYSCLGYGDHLLLQVGTTGGLGTSKGDVIVSLDGDTAVKDSGGANADVIWHLPPGNFIGPAPAPWGQEMIPFFITETDLYALDFWSRKAYKVAVGLNYIKAACIWDESIVLTDGYNIIQYIPGEPGVTRRIGIAKEQGFMEAGGPFRVETLQGVSGGGLYANITANDDAWVWVYQGAAWHPLSRKALFGDYTEYGIGLLVTDASYGAVAPGNVQQIVWAMATDGVEYPSEKVRAYRIRDPLYDPNPLVGTPNFWSNEHYMWTPWLDGGFRELDGAAFQMWFGGTIPTGTHVHIYYRTDWATGWTLLGTFDGTNTHLNFGSVDGAGQYPGVQFRVIQFRIGIFATATASPNALPLTFVFRKKPTLRMSYLVTIDASRELVENSKTFAAIMTELATAWNLKTLARFYYPVRTEVDGFVADGSREVDKRVDIVAMPTQEEEIRQSMRKGRIQIQVMEPSSW